MNELALFAGTGGGILASRLLGWDTVAAVEIEPYCRKVLLQRQRDGILPFFPIWDDVKTFDGKPWRGILSVISGGFPCQDVSVAGKGVGIRTGKHSGLWSEFARIIGESRPHFAFVENSPELVARGLDIVLSDLAEMGYDARWCVLGAGNLGGSHRRERMFILAHADRSGREVGRSSSPLHQTNQGRKDRRSASGGNERGKSLPSGSYGNGFGVSIAGLMEGLRKASEGVWDESRLGRVSHGVSHRLDRIRAIGNAQVPQVAAAAFLLLSEGLI